MSFVERSSRSTWRVRYWRDDGTHGSLSGFPTKAAAEAKARELDADRQRGQFIDPDAGTLSLADWTTTWFDALDVAPTTRAQYRSLIRTHILPRWGTTALAEVSGTAVNTWIKKLRDGGYAPATVSTILKVLSMILADAADERLIPANPIRRPRRGRRHHHAVAEAVWVTPEQALQVALHAARLTTPALGLLVITAAWTGARWGELTGLHRDHTHLNPHSAPGGTRAGTGSFTIDARAGALHEGDQQLFLGTVHHHRRPPSPPAPSPCPPSWSPSSITTCRPTRTSTCSPLGTEASCGGRTSPAGPCAPPPTAPPTNRDPPSPSRRWRPG
jgi:hypothetical protein